jgi:hypothetical protein
MIGCTVTPERIGCIRVGRARRLRIFWAFSWAAQVIWLVVLAAADEVPDDGVGVSVGRPGDADLAGADFGDGC